MGNWFLDVPLWLTGLIVVAGSFGVGAAVVLLVRPWVRARYSDEHNSVFSNGFSAVGTMYAIIAGLLVFGLFTAFQEASTASTEESSSLLLMYRNTRAFPEPLRGQALDAIEGYTQSVVTDEWPDMADGGGSANTRRALDHLYNVWTPIIPPDNAEWSDEYEESATLLNTVAKLRAERLNHSDSTLPPIYWFLMFVGGFLTITYMAFTYTENRTMHVLAVGMMATMLGMVLFLLIAVNHPFRGEIAVAPTMFTDALDRMAQIGR